MTTNPNTNYATSKTARECRHFNYSGGMITNNARCKHEIKSRVVMARAAFNKRKVLYRQQIELNFEDETRKVLHLDYSFKWCRNLVTSESISEMPEKFLKYGAVEG